jgi:hypothetical protein
VWVTLRTVTQAIPVVVALSIAICIARRATTMPKALSPSSMAVEGRSRTTWTLGRAFRSPSLIIDR